MKGRYRVALVLSYIITIFLVLVLILSLLLVYYDYYVSPLSIYYKIFLWALVIINSYGVCLSIKTSNLLKNEAPITLKKTAIVIIFISISIPTAIALDKFGGLLFAILMGVPLTILRMEIGSRVTKPIFRRLKKNKKISSKD